MASLPSSISKSISGPIAEHDTGVQAQENPGQLQGITLYYSPACIYCLRVHAAIKSLGLRIAGKNVLADSVAVTELYREGGRRMVPCLSIQEGASTRWLYESGDIIDFLHTRAAC